MRRVAGALLFAALLSNIVGAQSILGLSNKKGGTIQLGSGGLKKGSIGTIAIDAIDGRIVLQATRNRRLTYYAPSADPLNPFRRLSSVEEGLAAFATYDKFGIELSGMADDNGNASFLTDLSVESGARAKLYYRFGRVDILQTIRNEQNLALIQKEKRYVAIKPIDPQKPSEGMQPINLQDPTTFREVEVAKASQTAYESFVEGSIGRETTTLYDRSRPFGEQLRDRSYSPASVRAGHVRKLGLSDVVGISGGWVRDSNADELRSVTIKETITDSDGGVTRSFSRDRKARVGDFDEFSTGQLRLEYLHLASAGLVGGKSDTFGLLLSVRQDFRGGQESTIPELLAYISARGEPLKPVGGVSVRYTEGRAKINLFIGFPF